MKKSIEAIYTSINKTLCRCPRYDKVSVEAYRLKVNINTVKSSLPTIRDNSGCLHASRGCQTRSIAACGLVSDVWAWFFFFNSDAGSRSGRCTCIDCECLEWRGIGILGAESAYGENVWAPGGSHSMAGRSEDSIRCITRWMQTLWLRMCGHISGMFWHSQARSLIWPKREMNKEIRQNRRDRTSNDLQALLCF